MSICRICKGKKGSLCLRTAVTVAFLFLNNQFYAMPQPLSYISSMTIEVYTLMHFLLITPRVHVHLRSSRSILGNTYSAYHATMQMILLEKYSTTAKISTGTVLCSAYLAETGLRSSFSHSKFEYAPGPPR